MITFFTANTKKLLLFVSILSFLQPRSVSALTVNTPTKHLLTHMALLATTCVLPAALNEWEKESLNLQTKSVAETDAPATLTFKEKCSTYMMLAQTVGKNLLRAESYDQLKKLRAIFGPSKIDAQTKSIEELEQFSTQQELTKYISQNRLAASLILIELANIVRSGASVIQYAMQPKIVEPHVEPHVDPLAGAVPPPPFVDPAIAEKAALVFRLKAHLNNTNTDEEIDLMDLDGLKATLRELNVARLGATNTHATGNKNPLTLVQGLGATDSHATGSKNPLTLERATLPDAPEPAPVTIRKIPSFAELQETRRQKVTLGAKIRNLWLKKKARAELSALQEEKKQKNSKATKIAATWRGFFSRKENPILEQKNIFNQAHDVSDLIKGNPDALSAMETHPEKDDMPAPAVSLEDDSTREAREVTDALREQKTARAHSNWDTFVRKLSRAKSTAIIVHPNFQPNDTVEHQQETLPRSGASEEKYAANCFQNNPRFTTTNSGQSDETTTGSRSEDDEYDDDDSFEAGSVSTAPDCQVGDQESIDREESDHGYDTDFMSDHEDEAPTAPQAVTEPHHTADTATSAATMPTTELEPEPEDDEDEEFFDAHPLTEPSPAIILDQQPPAQLTQAPRLSNKQRKKLRAAAAAQARKDQGILLLRDAKKPTFYTDQDLCRKDPDLYRKCLNFRKAGIKKDPESMEITGLDTGKLWITKLINGQLEVLEVTEDGFTFSDKKPRDIINLYNKDIPMLARIIGCDAEDKRVCDILGKTIDNQIMYMQERRRTAAHAQRLAEAEAAKPWWKRSLGW